MIKIINAKSLYSSIYEAVEFCKENENEKIEIIVPDKLTLFMEKFLFEKLNIGCSFNIKVSSFNRFAKRNLEIDKTKQISKVGSIILINKILNENAQQFKSLRNKTYSFSYAEEIFKTIAQLKSSKITFEEMKNFSSNNVALFNKIHDLAVVYEEYEKQKAGKLDSFDMFLSSTLFVADGRENEKIVFVGFDDFTAIEYSIIEQLAIKSNVTVITVFSKEENQSIFNDEIYLQLKNIALTNQLPFSSSYSSVNNSYLKKFFESNLFSLNKKKFILDEQIVQLFSGNSLSEEIEFVARDIRKNILDGYNFLDFGVAVFDLNSNAEKIKKIFEKYEINYYIDQNLSINKSVLYKFFGSVFKYNFENYNQSHLIDIINSPFFEAEESEKRLIIDAILNSNFKGFVTDKFKLNLEESVKNNFIKFMKCLKFDANSNVAQIVDFIKGLYEQLGFENIMNELINQTDVENQIVLSKSKEVIFELFDEIVKLYKTATANDFFEIYSNISSVLEINNLPLTLDCVKVTEAENCKEIFDELYVVNCTKANAPKLKHDCGIILDSEIGELNFSNKLSPTISHINKLSKLKLFNLLTLFENSLSITFTDLPSDAIVEIKDRTKVTVDCMVLNLPIISVKTFDKYLVLSKWDKIEFLCCDNNQSKNIVFDENIVKNKDFNQISNEKLKIFNNFNTISSSNLENYFKCPFNNFLDHTLKIKPRLESSLLSFDIGNILHDIMCEYYSRKKDVGDKYEFCKNKIFGYIESDVRLKDTVNDLFISNLLDEAIRAVNNMDNIDNNSNFVNILQEFEFKDKTAYKLNNINLIGKVDRVDACSDMFRILDYKSGKIDLALNEIYYGNKLQLFLYSNAVEKLIDKNFVGCFYVPLHNDYTKADKKSDLEGYFLNENFVLTNLDKTLNEEEKSSMLGITLTKQGVANKRTIKAMDSNQILDVKRYVDKVSEQAVEEIKSGFIAPFPNEKFDSCEYCPYSSVCLKNSSNLKTRKAKSVTIDSFKEVDHE